MGQSSGHFDAVYVQLAFFVISLSQVCAMDDTLFMSSTLAMNGTLKCYQCNSGEAYDGSPCAEESLPPLAPFLLDCPVDDGLVYTRCRKIVQTVYKETRVVRSCATAGWAASQGHEPTDHCFDRVGTMHVKIRYCECHNANPDAPCNSATPRRASLTNGAVTSLVVMATVASLRL